MTQPEIAAFLRDQSAAAIVGAYPENGKEGDHTGFFDLPQQFRDGVVLPSAEALRHSRRATTRACR